MQSFRTELENPLVEKDIIDLERKIRAFREGSLPEEKFRSLRLARGVYGQRQPGVQMVRIKLPYGKMSFAQWKRIAAVSDEYSNGNLHLTTRQDIQIHFVSLDRTPQLWAELEKDEITLREACGNTVRNITASDTAGIDPDEPFDVSPYAQALFSYFLRKPLCQEMGRKFKIAISNNERDTAYTFMHDLGAIARIRVAEGVEQRGFKVLLGGGLGAQPHLAETVYEFLPEDRLIPYLEAVLRVFERYGERNSRHKARIKFLIKKIGLAAFQELVEAEQKALTHTVYPIDYKAYAEVRLPDYQLQEPVQSLKDPLHFERWRLTNVVAQRQSGFFAVYVRVPNGNISSDTSRWLADKLRNVVADDIRITINQGLQFRYAKAEHLHYIFSVLLEAGLAAPGFGTAADVTSCPGTDTCNLGISNSTGAALAIGELVEEEFPQLLFDQSLSVKISGCMNSCGQHAMASIGFHGSSLKYKGQVVPALQVLIGGGVLGSGEARIADKVIKVPSRRVKDVLRTVLNDYLAHRETGDDLSAYARKKGEVYFYELLKPLAQLDEVAAEELLDWGQTEKFSTAIGVGECAGVMVDLVSTLILEADEKLLFSAESLEAGHWADSIHQSYAAYVHAAKALLLQEGVQCNTQAGILKDFDLHFSDKGRYPAGDFTREVLRMNEEVPSAGFAQAYREGALQFIAFARQYRQQTVLAAKE